MTIFESVVTNMFKYMSQEAKAETVNQMLKLYCMYPIGDEIRIVKGSGDCSVCPFARYPKCWEEDARFLLKDIEEVRKDILRGGDGLDT